MFDVAVILDWATQVINPAKLMRRALEAERESGLPSVFKRFWAFPILLSFTLNGVVLYAFNISNTIFVVLFLFLATIKVFIDAEILFIIIRIFGIRASMGTIFACYTSFVIFSPIFSLSDLPQTYHQYAVIKDVRSQHLDLTHSWYYLRDHAKELGKGVDADDAKIIDIFSSIFEYVTDALLLVTMVFLSEGLSQALQADRVRIYIAACVTTWLALIPHAFFVVFDVLLVFAAMK